MLRGPGSPVHAGTLNVGSTVLLVKTTSAAGDTAVARMAALVEQVQTDLTARGVLPAGPAASMALPRLGCFFLLGGLAQGGPLLVHSCC